MPDPAPSKCDVTVVELSVGGGGTTDEASQGRCFLWEKGALGLFNFQDCFHVEETI